MATGMSGGAARRQIVGDMLDYKMIRAVSNFDDKANVMQGIGLLGQAVHAAVTGDKSFITHSIAEQFKTNTDQENKDNEDKGKDDKKKEEVENQSMGYFDFSTPGLRLASVPFKRLKSHAPFFRDYNTDELYGTKPIPRLETPSPVQRRRIVPPGVRGVIGGFDPRRSAFGNEVASVPATADDQSYELKTLDGNTETRIDEKQRMAQLSFLGEAGAAFSEGYNYTVDRFNYKQRVWQQQKRDFDEIQGKFNIDPSGLEPFDQTTRAQVNTVIDEAFELYKNRGKMSPEEYSKQMGQLEGFADQHKLGMEAIKTMVKRFVEDQDGVSKGSDAEVMDLYRTLANGGGNLKIEVEDGISWLRGTTDGGLDITKTFDGVSDGNGKGIAIKDLAGPNAFRYLKKFNLETWYNANLNGGEDGTGENVDGLLQDEAIFVKDGSGKFIVKRGIGAYEGRTQVSPSGVPLVSGVSSNNVRKVRETINRRVENIMQNDSRVRALAGDRLGIDSDLFNEEAIFSQNGSEKVKGILSENDLKRLQMDTGGKLDNFEFRNNRLGRVVTEPQTNQQVFVPVSGRELAETAVDGFVTEGLISRLNDQALQTDVKNIALTAAQVRTNNYNARRKEVYRLATSQMERIFVPGQLDMMTKVDGPTAGTFVIPGLEKLFVDGKNIAKTEIKETEDGKIKLFAYGPTTTKTVSGGSSRSGGVLTDEAGKPTGELSDAKMTIKEDTITTTGKTLINGTDITSLFSPRPTDPTKLKTWLRDRNAIFMQFANIITNNEMGAFDRANPSFIDDSFRRNPDGSVIVSNDPGSANFNVTGSGLSDFNKTN